MAKHHFFIIGRNIDYKTEVIVSLLEKLNEGYVIVSAVASGDSVQYILKEGSDRKMPKNPPK